MQSFPTLGIRARLWWLAATLIVALVVSSSLALLIQRRGTESLRSAYTQRILPMQQIKYVADAYAVTVADTVHKVLHGALRGERGADIVADAMRSAFDNWAEFRASGLTPAELALVERAGQQMLMAEQIGHHVAVLMSLGDREALGNLAANELYLVIDPLSSTLDDLVRLQRTTTRAMVEDRLRESERVQLAMAIGTALVTLLALVLAHRLVRSVTLRLDRAVAVASAVAAGNVDTPIVATRDDEIGQLLKAVDRMRGSLVALAESDPLTQLVTRRRFEAQLRAEAERGRRAGEPWAVLAIDLDHFKRINDTYGHAGGDAVLRRTAGAMRQTLRGIDTLARCGGEEFFALLPGTTAEQACRAAERLRAAVAAQAAEHAGRRIDVTCSIGVAEAGRGCPPDHVVELADRALYAAKRGGRNRVVLGGEGLPAEDEAGEAVAA
jgi:diguanylate cyclase (GGDEF)-like protein